MGGVESEINVDQLIVGSGAQYARIGRVAVAHRRGG
jgi:hypothetical protein